MNTYATLNTQPLKAFIRDENRLDVSEYKNLDQAPAHQMMHNLLLFPMQNIDESSSIDEANLVLSKTLRRASFVVDKKSQIIGMISTARLGSRYMISIAEKRGCARADLSVTDVMIPIKDMLQVSLKQVMQSDVGTVVRTMEKTGAEFLIVVDDITSMQVGYFDLIDLAKVYGKPLNTIKPANNFRDIVGTLLHHNEM